MAIKNVAVLGCGLMGSGIAQVCAQAGRGVTVIEVAEEFLKKGLAEIAKQLARAVEKGRLTADDKDQTQARLRGSTSLEDAASADIVIEAIIENMDEKHKTYSRLDHICRPDTIFSTLKILSYFIAAPPPHGPSGHLDYHSTSPKYI